MRPFEILLCCLAVPALVLLLAGVRPAPRVAHVYCLLLAFVLVAHVFREGIHWQMAPLYLAILALLFAGSALHRTSQTSLRWVGLACFLFVGLSCLLSWFMPMFRLPAPTGKYAVGTRILYMVDPGRDAMGISSTGGKRELMVQVWYPAKPAGEKRAVYRRWTETTWLSSYQAVLRTDSYSDAAVDPEGAPYPLLLFNPAWTGQRTQSTFLMQELASHGFVVVGIDHTYYSGRTAFPDGHVTDASRAPDIGNFEHATVPEGLALGSKYTRIEADDDIFVLSRMQVLNQDGNSPWYKRLDMTRVGALGHSLGGAAAAEAAYLDPRIKAALNMDGWMFGDSLSRGLPKPYMLIYEKGTEFRPSPAELAAAPEAVQKYWQMDEENLVAVGSGLRRYGGYWLYIDGTSHWNFSDRALYSPLRSRSQGGPIPPRRAYTIINRYVLAFFEHALNGTTEPLLEGNPDDMPEVQFEAWKPAGPQKSR